jgi:hypothetical protein
MTGSTTGKMPATTTEDYPLTIVAGRYVTWLRFRAVSALQASWFLGHTTWASARQTRFNPGYHITGLQP